MAKSPVSILYDESGNPVGVVLDGSIYRLQVQTKVVRVDGEQINPATEETLAAIKDTDGIKKIVDPLMLSPDSPKIMESADLLLRIYVELGRIRTLLEFLTDETVEEGDVES